jgi:hypothetical protein
MHVSTLIRHRAALLAVLATAAACSDATVAPKPAERPAFDIQALQPLDSRDGGPSGSSAYYKESGNENVATLTINPNVSWTYAFGEHWIYFPARSICDPATSGYGPTLWDTPCTPTAKAIRITVHWSNSGGHAYARFEPALRFVPAAANNPSRWVILSLHDHKRLDPTQTYSILYGTDDGRFIDESLTDPTLRAWVDPLHNSVVRRIKHFTGYWLAAGYGLGGFDDASY